MLIKSFCPKLVPAFSCEKIQTLWVDSPLLSASYYKEYLGFSVLFRCCRKDRGEVLIHKKGNFIRLKTFKKDSQGNGKFQGQIVTIYSNEITNEYQSLKSRVRVKQTINPIINDSFSLIDCNGIEVVYKKGSKILLN